MRRAKLICVGVDVRVKGRLVRLRVVAGSIREAVEMAGPLDDEGRARLVLPIDGERFFVGNRARRRGWVTAACVPDAPKGPAPREAARRPVRSDDGRPRRGA